MSILLLPGALASPLPALAWTGSFNVASMAAALTTFPLRIGLSFTASLQCSAPACLRFGSTLMRKGSSKAGVVAAHSALLAGVLLLIYGHGFGTYLKTLCPEWCFNGVKATPLMLMSRPGAAPASQRRAIIMHIALPEGASTLLKLRYLW